VRKYRRESERPQYSPNEEYVEDRPQQRRFLCPFAI
jgi:hypothetical protein